MSEVGINLKTARCLILLFVFGEDFYDYYLSIADESSNRATEST